jgi:ATP phosphoribosyltransferase regulatory subunit
MKIRLEVITISRLFMFEKPLGMRDTLPQLYDTKSKIRTSIGDVMKGWGFQFIETPTLEYYETIGAASAILDQQLFKLLDPQGHTLVLRPDMTAPIARVAASKILNENYPLRLAYSVNVYRAQQREGGRPAEFEQIGVELIGDGTVSADGEVIALMISALKESGLKGFQISIGHIGFLQDLFLQILGTEERVKTLMKFLYEKNYVGYREHVKSLSLSTIDKQRLFEFLNLRGSVEVINQALALVENEKGKESVLELKKLWETMEDYGEQEMLKFDLTLVSHMSYYTGILFEVYAGQVGFPIGNGGRYDGLFQKFGKKTSATGFALRLDRLVESLGHLHEINPSECILFSEDRRKEAIQIAKVKRSKGLKVVLQDINGVKHIDACTNQYEEITFLLGKAGGRSST